MIAFANTLYGWLLLAYPPVYRRAYAAEMSLTFREMNRDTLQQDGLRGLVVLWARTLIDYGDSLLTAYAESLRERNLGPQINALIVALIVPGVLLWVAAFFDLVLDSPWLFDNIFIPISDSAIPDNISYGLIAFLMPGIAFLLSMILWKRNRVDGKRAYLPYVILGISVFIIFATAKFLIGENLIPYLQETF
jgi:hypothetical protein